MMELDFPKVRAQEVCPLCQATKEAGLLVCWPCYRQHELRYGNPAALSRIANAQDQLAVTTGKPPQWGLETARNPPV